MKTLQHCVKHYPNPNVPMKRGQNVRTYMLTCMHSQRSHGLTASLSPTTPHKPLLWAHNCRADNTATVIVLQLAALHHMSACLSSPALSH